MGINASADLIWGVVVKAYTEDGDPVVIREVVYHEDGQPSHTDIRPLHDDERGWDSLGGTRLELVDVGHYEDPEPKAILTLKDSKRFSADCWDYTAINPRNDLLWEPAEKQVKKGGDEALSLGLPDLREGQWWLIAGEG